MQASGKCGHTISSLPFSLALVGFRSRVEEPQFAGVLEMIMLRAGKQHEQQRVRCVDCSCFQSLCMITLLLPAVGF